MCPAGHVEVGGLRWRDTLRIHCVLAAEASRDYSVLVNIKSDPVVEAEHVTFDVRSTSVVRQFSHSV